MSDARSITAKESKKDQADRKRLATLVNEAIYAGYLTYVAESKASQDELAHYRNLLGLKGFHAGELASSIAMDAIHASNPPQKDAKSNIHLSLEKAEVKGVPEPLKQACAIAVTKVLSTEYANKAVPSSQIKKALNKYTKYFSSKPKKKKITDPKTAAEQKQSIEENQEITMQTRAQGYISLLRLCESHVLNESLHITPKMIIDQKINIAKMKKSQAKHDISMLENELLTLKKDPKELTKKTVEKNLSDSKSKADTITQKKTAAENHLKQIENEIAELNQGKLPELKQQLDVSESKEVKQEKTPLRLYENYVTHLQQLLNNNATPLQSRKAALDHYIQVFEYIFPPQGGLDSIRKMFQTIVEPGILASDFLRKRLKYGADFPFISTFSSLSQAVDKNRAAIIEEALFDAVDVFIDAAVEYNKLINSKESHKKINFRDHGHRMRLAEWIYEALPGIQVNDPAKKTNVVSQIEKLFIRKSDGEKEEHTPYNFIHPAFNMIDVNSLCFQITHGKTLLDKAHNDLSSRGLQAESAPPLLRPISHVSRANSVSEEPGPERRPSAIPRLARRKSTRELIQASRKGSRERSKSIRDLNDKGGRSTPPPGRNTPSPFEHSKSSRTIAEKSKSSNTFSHTPPLAGALPSTSKEKARKREEEFIDQHLQKIILAEKLIRRSLDKSNGAIDKKDEKPMPDTIIDFVKKWALTEHDVNQLVKLITIDDSSQNEFKIQESLAEAANIVISKNLLDSYAIQGAIAAKRSNTNFVLAAKEEYYASNPEYIKYATGVDPSVYPLGGIGPNDILQPLPLSEDDPTADKKASAYPSAAQAVANAASEPKSKEDLKATVENKAVPASSVDTENKAVPASNANVQSPTPAKPKQRGQIYTDPTSPTLYPGIGQKHGHDHGHAKQVQWASRSKFAKFHEIPTTTEEETPRLSGHQEEDDANQNENPENTRKQGR